GRRQDDVFGLAADTRKNIAFSRCFNRSIGGGRNHVALLAQRRIIVAVVDLQSAQPAGLGPPLAGELCYSQTIVLEVLRTSGNLRGVMFGVGAPARKTRFVAPMRM